MMRQSLCFQTRSSCPAPTRTPFWSCKEASRVMRERSFSFPAIFIERRMILHARRGRATPVAAPPRSHRYLIRVPLTFCLALSRRPNIHTSMHCTTGHLPVHRLRAHPRTRPINILPGRWLCFCGAPVGHATNSPSTRPPPPPHSQLLTLFERPSKTSCGGGCMLNTNEHFPNCSWVKVCNESMITSTRRVTRSCSTSERSLRAPLSSRSSCNNNPQSPHPPLAPHPRPHRPLRTSCP